jgi:hypothetical protein
VRGCGDATASLNPCSNLFDDFEIHIGGAQRQCPARSGTIGPQQHIRENGDRVASFDDALHVSQSLQESNPFDREFHVGAHDG